MNQGSETPQTENVAPPAEPERQAPQDLRKSVRDGIFTNPKMKPARKAVRFMDQDLELRQPTLEQVLSLSQAQTDDPDSPINTQMVQVIIEHTFVPGTDLQVFDNADLETLMKMPFGEDFTRISEAFTELTDIKLEAAVKNSDGTSSTTT